MLAVCSIDSARLLTKFHTFDCGRKALQQAAAMDEMDLPQMKKEVESLKYQLAFKREKSSKTVTDLVKWIEDGVPEDPFLNPELMKNNPWVEKGKCILL
uniref:Guanine nucleotide-binding protein subunit gamma n=1 Tax=Oreochromis aureus TaxID=47969 RepID=A0AAZ1XXI5_OREAU